MLEPALKQAIELLKDKRERYLRDFNDLILIMERTTFHTDVSEHYLNALITTLKKDLRSINLSLDALNGVLNQLTIQKTPQIEIKAIDAEVFRHLVHTLEKVREKDKNFFSRTGHNKILFIAI